MVANATTNPNVSARGRARADYTRQRMAQRSKVTQALEMQEEIREALKGPIAPMQRAALISAWDKLEERIRILRGKPLPGSLRPEPTRAKRKALSGLGAMLVYPEQQLGAVAMHDASPDAGPGPGPHGDQANAR